MGANPKSIVSKGRTVKEAIAIALDLLNEEMDRVHIEIIENESKGILGLGSKPAVVRVTVKEDDDLDASKLVGTPSYEELEQLAQSIELNELSSSNHFIQQIEQQESALLGKVWVKDGQIFCKNAPDKYPLLSPGKGVKLYKNGELVQNTVIINETDILNVELEDEVREPKWELTISPDKMEVTLKVVPGIRIYRRIKDRAPDHYIELEIEEKEIPIIIENGPVMNKLREMGISHGIDFAAIALACTSDDAGSFIIAKGTAPIPGKNGYFLPLQEVEITKRLKERSDGSIDYREIQQFPSVDRGQVIGTIQPPVPGIPGVTVTNETVLPPEVYPLVVQEGRGVFILEEEYKVIATEAGHPDIKQKGTLAQISVVPKLMIGKDIDLKFGNVHYVGDVEIVGSVQDSMIVEAKGNVLIHQNVNMAKVSAGSSAIVKNNIITSEVSAGKSSLLIAEIKNTLGEFIYQIRNMESAMKQLSVVSAFKMSSFSRTGLGPLIKILCEGKFKSFPALTNSLINKINESNDILDAEWKQFSERLYRGFITTHISDFKSIEEITQLVIKSEQLYAQIETDNDVLSNCFIKADFAHNSKLFSGGDIAIVGPGVYQSKLHALGFIEIDGYVRGGEIYAAKGVVIGEAGSKGGASTKIAVAKEGTIRLKKAMEETIIQIGSRTHKFTVQSSNVFARLSKDGQLVIS